MKKLLVGAAAVGAVVALRPVVKRRVLQKMREHCGQMAEHCKRPVGESASRSEPMGARHEEHSEPVATA